VENFGGKWPDTLAFEGGFPDVLRMLNPTAAEDFTHEACNASARLRAVAEDDVATLSSTADEGPVTALMVACKMGRRDLVDVLLPSSNVDAQSESGVTALCLVAESGNAEIVQALLDAGANVALKDADGNTALHRASEPGHAAVAKLLCARRA
jgi:ankyrin repeat protein